MKQKSWNFVSWMDKVVDIVGGSLFFVMVMLTGFNVVSFWVTGRRYGQLEELVVSCLVWVTYLSLGQHYRDKECIRADFLLTALPPKGQKAVEVLTDLAALVIGGVILYFGLLLMLRSTDKHTGVLKICYFWIDLGLVLGFASLVFNIIWKYVPHKKAQEKEGDPAC